MNPTAAFWQLSTSVHVIRILPSHVDRSRGQFRTGAVYTYRTSCIWVNSFGRRMIRLHGSTTKVLNKNGKLGQIPVLLSLARMLGNAASLPGTWIWQVALVLPGMPCHLLFWLIFLLISFAWAAATASAIVSVSCLWHDFRKWAVLKRGFLSSIPRFAAPHFAQNFYKTCWLRWCESISMISAAVVIGFFVGWVLSSSIFVWVGPRPAILLISSTSHPTFDSAMLPYGSSNEKS